VPERDPHAPAVKRVGTGGVEKDGAGAKGGRIAEYRAQVLLVVHPLDDHQQWRDEPGQQLAGWRDGQPAGHGQQATMDIETRDRRHQVVADDVNRYPGG